MIVAEGDRLAVPSAYVLASMGPQLDSCGRLAAFASIAPDDKLQWGRNLIVAEGR